MPYLLEILVNGCLKGAGYCWDLQSTPFCHVNFSTILLSLVLKDEDLHLLTVLQ